MSSKPNTAFFAYPGAPIELTSTIEAAVRLSNSTNRLQITPWPEMGIFGKAIPDTVRESIQNSDVVIFDVTVPNQNVYYEAGYAIGLGKPVFPVVNSSFNGAFTNVQKDGIFDNIGISSYENSDSLAASFSNITSNILLDLYGKEFDNRQPLFILEPIKKTDFRNAIVSAVKSSKVHYRSFDPVETPRLSTFAIIGQLSASSGIILPLLSSNIEDYERHNLRASFVAGIGHGLERDTLLIELARFDGSRPADYRDFVTAVTDDNSTSNAVVDFCKAAYLAGQNIKSRPRKNKRTALQKLSLGASAAENEFRTLSSYFVETSEFVRTMRGEVNVVAGRKGSGKTAIFFQARDNFRQQRNSFVTDLKPESHQLSLFRTELQKILDVGAFDHSLAAFWYFLILSEILITIQQNIEYKSKVDSKALENLYDINQWLDKYGINESGDFTTRINRLGNYVVQEIDAAKSRKQAISADLLTNIIFRGGITDLKKTIYKNIDHDDQIVLLFDNIDKGWPTNGVDEFDIRLVRLLIETLDKIQRDFNASKKEFMSVVFLRNDIYEMLVEGTPDRGKSGQVRIDWTDRAKLKQVIYKRLQSSLKDNRSTFEQLWLRFFPDKVEGNDSFDFFVDHCLMRPRFLINIVENAISNAVNRGHEKVSDEDCIDAVRQHSLYLIDDFGYEIRDVSGLSEDLLYAFVGAEKSQNKAEFIAQFVSFGLNEEDSEKAFDLMLWYGVIGIKNKSGNDAFIYNYEYNMKRLKAEARSLGEKAMYVTNPALQVALNDS